MNHLAAAVLLHLGGKQIDDKGIKSILEAAGTKADDKKIKNLVEKLKGKDVMVFAKENMSKLGGGAVSSAPVVEVKEEKKDDKKGGKKDAPKKKAPKTPSDSGSGMGMMGF